MSDGDPASDAWRKFGGDGNGVAIKTTDKRLRTALAPICGRDGPTYLGKVRYIDHATTAIPDANTLDAVFTVRNDYINEREARALIYTYGGSAIEILCGKRGIYGPLVILSSEPSVTTGRHELIGGHRGGKAIVLETDAAALIEEIVIGADVKKEDANTIRTLICDSGLERKLRILA